jgi:fucose permease
MSIAGGALLPLVYGKLADMPAIGNHRAYLILIPCYLFILYYAIREHKRENRFSSNINNI